VRWGEPLALGVDQQARAQARLGGIGPAAMVRRLQQYEQAFQRNDIDGEVLLELSAEDFDWFSA